MRSELIVDFKHLDGSSQLWWMMQLMCLSLKTKLRSQKPLSTETCCTMALQAEWCWHLCHSGECKRSWTPCSNWSWIMEFCVKSQVVRRTAEAINGPIYNPTNTEFTQPLVWRHGRISWSHQYGLSLQINWNTWFRPKPSLRIRSETRPTKSTWSSRKVPLQLRAEILEVPHALYEQTDGLELGQIAVADIASASRGVALVNIAEALPFLHLREAVCPNGVALLILEFDDPPPSDTAPSDESAGPVQGHQRPTHHKGSSCSSRPPTGHAQHACPNACSSWGPISGGKGILVFKDQFAGQWQDFVKSPV